MEIWQVARAATAAPLFFKPFDGPEDPEDNTFIRFVDGGLYRTNNPTWEGLEEIKGLHGNDSLSLVLSVGTARTNKKPGKSLRKQVESIVNGANDPEDVHEQVKIESNRGKFSYYRFNDAQGTHAEMDECEPRRPRGGQPPGSVTLQNIRRLFEQWLNKEEHQIDLRACATKLVKQRRARTCDQGQWETFSTASEYYCDYTNCEETLLSKYDYRDHLVQRHNERMEDIDDERILSRRTWEYQEERVQEGRKRRQLFS